MLQLLVDTMRGADIKIHMLPRYTPVLREFLRDEAVISIKGTRFVNSIEDWCNEVDPSFGPGLR